MITLDSVTKRHGGFTAVDDVSLVARPGQVTGFLGPNGAGMASSSTSSLPGSWPDSPHTLPR